VGLKEMVMKVRELYPKYKAVVMSNGHYIPYLFYNKVDPKEFIVKSDFAAYALAKGVRVQRYDKIYFNMPDECPTAGKKEVLYVCFGYLVPKEASLIDVIRFRDGQPAIILVEFKGGEKDRNLPQRLKYADEVDTRFLNGVIPEEYENYWPVK
jgi:hypothetical protein